MIEPEDEDWLREIYGELEGVRMRLIPGPWRTCILNYTDAPLFKSALFDLQEILSRNPVSTGYIRTRLKSVLRDINEFDSAPNGNHLNNILSLINSALYVAQKRDSKIHDPDFIFQINNDNYAHKRRVIIEILKNFDRMVSALRKRNREKPPFDVNDEYDVQDLLFSAIKLHFDHVEKEDTTAKHGGKSSRIDFLLKDINAGLEVKYVKDNMRLGELAAQISEDKEAYINGAGIKHLYFFIYDPDRLINNPESLKEHEEINKERYVRVIVSPKH